MSDLSPIDSPFTALTHKMLYNKTDVTEDDSQLSDVKDFEHTKKGMLAFLHDSDIEDNENDSLTQNNDLETASMEDLLLKNNQSLPVEEDLAAPIKRNTKNYQRDKVKLLGETQRLMRETPTESFKYKPKQYRTFGEFSQVLQSKKESQNTQKGKVVHSEFDKENIMSNINTQMILNECDDFADSLPLIERIGLSDYISESQVTQPKFIHPVEFAKKAEDFLRKINNNAEGSFELKSKVKYGLANANKAEILKNLRKSIDHNSIVVEKDSFTDLNTIVKTVDPDTGDVTLVNKTISVKKDTNVKMVKGIDPTVAKKMEANMSEKQLLEWTQMSKHEKYAFLQKTILSEAAEKRKALRLKRMGDMPISQDKKKSPKKASDRDGLSDDDTEWINDRDDCSDSEEDSTESEIEEDSDSAEEEIVTVMKGRMRRGVIEDDDDDEEGCLEEEVIEPFVDDTGVADISEDVFSILSCDKSGVICANGALRERKPHERSPLLQVDPTLRDVVLPEKATNLIADLKHKYGLVNSLVKGDSSILLLPTMKTTTSCIANLFKQQIVKEGYLSQDILSVYEEILVNDVPTNLAICGHKFNLLSSISIDKNNLPNYSFLNASAASSRILDNSAKVHELDETVIMEGSATIRDVSATDDNEALDKTVLLSQDETSQCAGNSCCSSDTNVIHAKLFGFCGTKEHHSSEDSTISAMKVFANLSSLMKDSQDGVDLDESEKDGGESEKNEDDSEKGENDEGVSEKDEDAEESNSENEDSESFVVDNDVEESSRSKMGLDDDDDEEVYRKRVQKGSKFVPTDYIDEEAQLSGSDAEDYGSDEDERGLDEYEEEEGDLEKLPSEGKLRRQIERIHNRMEIDQDAHDIRYIKEMYLEDGDLNMEDAGPRQKRFAWGELNDTEEFTRVARASDDEESEYEDQAGTLSAEEEVAQHEDGDQDSLIQRYDKFLVGSRLTAVTLEDEQVRPAWATESAGVPVTPAPPAMKRYGSMLHKVVHTPATDKPASKTISDFDLKSRMSVMFTSAPRVPETLKRGPSGMQACAAKKPRTGDS